MTATDLHQRMLHQLDRVKALNTSSPGDMPQNVEPRPHVSQAADAPAGQPHIPAVNDEQPVAEPQAAFSDEDDDRTEPRTEVRQQGLIVFAGLERGLECEIRDLSSAGAKLHLGGNVTVPSCFTLTILPENTSRSAQVCWRDEQELGIQFIEEE
ncbi:MAG: PilZ domain-containing protein [Pseudomonadota bacterium]